MLQLIPGGFLKSVDEDTSPQLGGDLDGQSLYGLVNMVDGTFSGTVTFGRVGIGELAPNKRLHITATDTGATNFGGEANVIIEDTGTSYLTFMSNTAGKGGITFGDTADPIVGAITYDHDTDLMSFLVNNAEAFRVDSDQVSWFNNYMKVMHGLSINRFHSMVTGAPFLTFGRARGTEASPLIPLDGDMVGKSDYWAWWDTTNKRNVARFTVTVDGVPGVGDVPGRFEFQTNPGADAAPTTRMTIKSDGNVGFGLTSPTGQLHVDQSSASGAKPVLRLDQADVDDTFVDFIGTSAADGSRSISSDATEDSAKFGAFRIEINGVTKWVRVYDDHS